MKISRKISKVLRSFTLMIGILSISISVFEYRIADRIEDELESARKNKEKGKETGEPTFLPDYQATISSFQLHLVNLPSLLGYTPVLISVRKWFQLNHPLNELNFFRTLFEHIIAPNAP